MSDAAFREAVEALIDGVVNSPQDESETTALRARVLALYAERQGEVYEVKPSRYTVDLLKGDAVVLPLLLLGDQYRPGDKVRVTKVEEGQ